MTTLAGAVQWVAAEFWLSLAQFFSDDPMGLNFRRVQSRKIRVLTGLATGRGAYVNSQDLLKRA